MTVCLKDVVPLELTSIKLKLGVGLSHVDSRMLNWATINVVQFNILILQFLSSITILPNNNKSHHLLLRKGGHTFALPQCTYCLYKNSFLPVVFLSWYDLQKSIQFSLCFMRVFYICVGICFTNFNVLLTFAEY